MKRLFTLVLLSLCINCALSQDIQVVSFKPVEDDLTANTSGTIVLDQNGEKCALIKVATSQKDFSFDAGMMGVAKTEQHPGEVWVYVPAGVKRLSISHDGMESLRDFDLGMTLKKACTYLLMLKTSKDVDMQELSFRITPLNAVVMLESDDDHFGRRMLQMQGGELSVKVPTGSYRYTAMADGCASEDGTFSLTSASPRKVILELHPIQDAMIQKQSQKNDVIVEELSDTIINIGSVYFKMMAVKGGTFTMGSASDPEASESEKPSHFVNLRSFRIGECEVTQELWTAVMGLNPSLMKRLPRYPVQTVSWDDCITFINRLNKMTGLSFRLPTEAEWEYAAHGGSKSKGYKYSGSNDVDAVAWHKGNSGGITHEVKTKLPNELGLYDMSGNVYEWCNDRYGEYTSETQTNPLGSLDGTSRVDRGGGSSSDPRSCRCTARSRDKTTDKFCTLGLRLAL